MCSVAMLKGLHATTSVDPLGAREDGADRSRAARSLGAVRSKPPAPAWMLVLTGERGRKPSLQARDTEVPTPYPFFPTLKTLILSGSFCPFFLLPAHMSV